MQKRKPRSVNKFIGAWRIVRMSEWDKEYCDMKVRAFIQIDAKGMGEFQFGLVSGSVCGDFIGRDGEDIFDFTWEGSDEASGDGWMKIKHDGTAEGKLRIHAGDSSRFWAKKTNQRTKK